MRRIFALCSLAAISVASFAQGGKDIVKEFNSKLLQAKRLVAVYTVQPVGGAPEDYTVVLGKPNLLKISAPWKIVAADGKTITTYDALGNTFYRMPDTLDNLASVFSDSNLSLWAGFFDPHAMEAVPEALYLGRKTIAGAPYTMVKVTMDVMGTRIDTFYFDSGALPRKAEFEQSSGVPSRLLNASRAELGDTIPPDSVFDFKLPAGTEELTREEVLASHWFDNLHDAVQEATATKKNIFLLFTSEKKGTMARIASELFPTAAFKRESKYFVFCNIDMDSSSAMAKTYSVTSTPAIFFVQPNGTRLGQMVGYPGVGQVITAMDAAHPAGG